MEIKKVSIIGLGALGILFGHHLSKRMPKKDLRIIADKNRIQKYQTDGVYCNDERCDFNYISPEEACEPADLLIFTVKFNGLQDAIKAVKNHVGENTIIISALNGISSEGVIGDAYGTDKVLYCVAQGMDAVKVGNKLTYANMGMLVFGDQEPGIISEKVKAVKAFFEKTEFAHEVLTDMKEKLWGKFMLNVGVNQTVAVYESNYGEIQKDGPAREMMIAAMREVAMLSEKEGITLTEVDITYWLDVLSKLSPEGKPSMAQDVEARRFSEVDLFAGTVLELGKKYGIPTPVNKEFYDRITKIESEY
ncbi:ketopantoate reductase [Schinkia azotoformans MEV2011]|uniref:2-dehydropantoate 2-reductase n=1 Tax=Schinkia azotoformans MEV2011 TaxID=1348973 RepID=A0A072NJN0_SCHAZ|nr:2-dehydropantoate 2-reductase [Schinkia azotoformans]KEF37914.1 ketopantoate reductase [Schinkia azotoformans MEV2011]MEC1696596.1 2-dehydropantoate 2-reductase [Schinkia azotoformans]MEC1716025.1 2-dehydropantoate 2-reductase [Schinkia azotoformans]MEC1725913.1 2-dehydropantoate 2-reductase [Schinkia azotoformans]MEC1740496.1 2-dehydropantoate 2-reductase [Schinkia azotoformans]